VDDVKPRQTCQQFTVLLALLQNISARNLPNTTLKKGFHVTGIYPLNENIFNVD